MNIIKNKIINILSNAVNLDEFMSISIFSTMSASSFFGDIIIPVLCYNIIIITLLGVAGPTIYLEISYVILNWFLSFFTKIKLRVQKYFWLIIAFIVIIHIFMCTLEFMLYNIKVLYFLMDFLPILGLVGLAYFNSSLVKTELVHKITFFAVMLIFGFIFGGLFFISIYIYEPHYLKIYFYLFICIRSIFGVLIFVGIIIYLFFMPWNKENWMKLGVLVFSLWLVGTLFNTTGKLSCYIFSYIKKEDPFQFKNISIYTELEKVDLDKLSKENLVGKGLPSEDLKAINIKRPKSAIFDYLDLSKLKPKVNQDFVKWNYPLKGKLPKIILFKWFIVIDLNKSVAKSPLLSDDRLFDFSPTMSVRPGPELTQDHYIKDGLWCTDLKFNRGFLLVRYDPSLQEGFTVKTFCGKREVYEFKLAHPYKGRGSNILDKLPKMEVNLNNSYYDHRNTIDLPRSYYSKSKLSISVLVPSDFNTENLNLTPIKTERLILRPLRITDAEAFSLIYGDPKGNWNTSYSYFSSMDVSRARVWIKNFIQDYHEPNKGVHLGVFLKNESGEVGELIGTLSGSAGSRFLSEPSFTFRKEYIGKGYGSEALKAWLDYYFSLPSRKVEMELPVDFIDDKYKNKATKLMVLSNFLFNERSINLAKKLNFKFWYLDQVERSKEDNLITRLLEKEGFDLMESIGFKIYKSLFARWDIFDNRYIREFNIYEYRFFFLLPKDRLFIYKWYNTPKYLPMESNGYLQGKRRLIGAWYDMYIWIISEEDFREKFK
jgi:[ribosomal protein S5]-alanine N-acetyltransferase